MEKQILVIDIGGTWLKGTLFSCEYLDRILRGNSNYKYPEVFKVHSKLSNNNVKEFINSIDGLLDLIPVCFKNRICAIGIATAGVVNYAGTELTFVGTHLQPLKDSRWISWLKGKMQIPVSLINDSYSTMLGSAALGYLKGDKTIGVMAIGTGLGFCVWRNGRNWTPGYAYTLLGSIGTPNGDYDTWLSAVSLANKNPDKDLLAVLENDEYSEDVKEYQQALSTVIQTASYLYQVDNFLIGGGLADAIRITNHPLIERIDDDFKDYPLLDGRKIGIKLLEEGNSLTLLGAGLLAYGEYIIGDFISTKDYGSSLTEKPYKEGFQLEHYTSESLINLFWEVEQEAAWELKHALPDIATVVEEIVLRLKDGGRLIYIGAGTSGRLASIDAVEIACTFGFPKDKILTLIAGGIADASIDIESNFEEDASSVKEMILTSVSDKDVVIGISASGAAYYVQSALAYSKHIGAYTVIIQESGGVVPTFCHQVIALRSGSEVIAGSTRMKAGTATKKVLNFLSTTSMILLGKVHGTYMTELLCMNQKLVLRAQAILKKLFDITNQEALVVLKEHGYNLSSSIKDMNLKNKGNHEK